MAIYDGNMCNSSMAQAGMNETDGRTRRQQRGWGRTQARPGRQRAPWRKPPHAVPRSTWAVAEAPREIGGRGGLEPVRYGDWEVKGLAVRLLNPALRQPVVPGRRNMCLST